ncbi:MAG TPA: hypothetical protein VGM41_03685 [Chitinophagaceae bacterium]|jgi:hypothetical protein
MKTLDIRVYKNKKNYVPEPDSADEQYINEFKKQVSEKYRNLINEIYASGGWFEVELTGSDRSIEPDLIPRNMHVTLLEKLDAIV